MYPLVNALVIYTYVYAPYVHGDTTTNDMYHRKVSEIATTEGNGVFKKSED